MSEDGAMSDEPKPRNVGVLLAAMFAKSEVPPGQPWRHRLEPPDVEPVNVERQVMYDADEFPHWAAIVEQSADVWFQSETGLPGFLTFRIVECSGQTMEGTTLYQDEDCQPTEDIDAAFVVASGSVKWDGCTNWNTNRECMVHMCDDSDTEAFARILVAAIKAARDTITPGWVR